MSITQPNPGERALMKYERNGVSVTRLPDDPICPRVSLGGEQGATYLVFRGEPETIKALLRSALAAMDA